MELNVAVRKSERKSECLKIRRKGNIPAVIYSRGSTGENLEVNGIEFQKILNGIPEGMLSTAVLTLKAEDGKSCRAIVKDIAYNVTTYDIIHLDFLKLVDDIPVSLNVPITCTGLPDCIGVKLGGQFRQLVRAFKVSCLPSHIPRSVEINVAGLNMGESVKLSSVTMPSNVCALADLNQIVVTISKC